jgi:CheY-like chemotaxis protein
MGHRAFVIEAPWPTRQWLMEKGTSTEYGARELKRTIHRHLTQPLASMVAKKQVPAGGRVRVDVAPQGDALSLRTVTFGEPPTPAAPTVLLVDDNAELLRFMTHATTESRWDALPARNVTEARKQFARRETHAAIIDIGVSEGCGLVLAAELREAWRNTRIVLTCDTEPSNEILEICDDHDFELVKKPFITGQLLDFLRDRVIGVRSGI